MYLHEGDQTMTLKRALISTAVLLAAQTIATLDILSAASPAVLVTPVLHASGKLQLTSTLSVPGGTPVVWSLNPRVGAVSAGGLYTAPVSITSTQTVLVTSTNVSDKKQSGSIAVTLGPTLLAAQTTATLDILSAASPAVVTPVLHASGKLQLTSTLSVPGGAPVVWSLNPQVGAVSAGGLYTAPVSITSTQTVLVTSTSVSDAKQSGSITVTLRPTVTLSLSPEQASIFTSQTQQCKATLKGATDTSVVWSIYPAVGNISTAGLYAAPATVAAAQTVRVTAISNADPATSASMNITVNPVIAISVSPTSAQIFAGQSRQFTALVGTRKTAALWSLTPAIGTVVSGLYTAPATVTAQKTVTLTATSEADPTKSASATITLTTLTTQIALPLEVIGPNGYTVSASFNIPSGTNLSGLNLWMQIHGLRSQTQASVQLNSSAWKPISQGTVTLLGLANDYGGIGGGFHTFQMTMPATGITTGSNTITFRFNGTDGAVSGFRVLQFNVQTASGSSLIPSSTFVNDDPDNWQPPSTAASDIAAGQTLWRTASLTVPTTTGSSPIKAHCMDCHAQDGRDLKYFNYSNNSIQTRSVFHGLTGAQGSQIASYIRSLNVPNPGRPWNPPYQPGPGLDSQPTSDWSAGAGIDAVVDSDAEMLPYLTPGGSTAGWAANQYLNQREIPIALQLPDWNSWLPVIHPMDAFGPSFTNSPFFTYYGKVRSELVPNDPTAYKNALIAFYDWSVAQGKYMVPITSAKSWTASLRTAVYSTSLWNMVKLWELNQEFGLEAMPQVVYGSKANIHSWYGSQPFYTSPTQQHIPFGPGLGNGTNVVDVYLSFVWYQMQLILNDGQGQEIDHTPIDFGYTAGRIKDLALAANNPPGINLELEWIIKTLQEETLSGYGPEKGQSGWQSVWTSPSTLVNGAWNGLWSGTSPSQRATLTTAYVNAWFAQIQNYTPQQFYQGGWATPTDNLPALDIGTSFGGQMWFMLPRLRYYGVDATLTDQVSAWAAKIWPKANWSLNNSATCSNGLTCTSGY
jgi:hypothetical protein